METNATVLPGFDFAEASDPQEGYERQEVYRVTILPSPHLVYLRGPKGKGRAKLWVRVGSSTRRLEVTDAVQCVSARWPGSVHISPQTCVHLLTLRRREVSMRLSGVVERVFTERTTSGLSAVEEE